MRFKRYFDDIWKSSLQSKMAVASFTAGVTIACVCLFFVEPIGEIATSGISVVSELLVLAGGLLGVEAHFDAKLQQFFAATKDELKKKQDKPDAEPEPVVEC